MSALPKSIVSTRHPARPRQGAVNIKAVQSSISKRFPKILAKLAE